MCHVNPDVLSTSERQAIVFYSITKDDAALVHFRDDLEPVLIGQHGCEPGPGSPRHSSASVYAMPRSASSRRNGSSR